MNALDDKVAKVVAFVKQNDNFLIIAHDHPDGDTLGSSLALHLVFKKIGKKSSLVCKSQIPEPFLFLSGASDFQQDFLSGDYDSLFLIDNGDLKRTGFDLRIKEHHKLRKEIINIDHHPLNDIWKMAKINVVDEKLSSTAEIVYKFISAYDPKLIDSNIATAILTGIYTDTGGFQHPTTTPEILDLSSHLLSLGAKLKKIKSNINDQRSFVTLKIWGLVLKNIVFNSEFGIVYSLVTRSEIKEVGGSDQEMAGVVNLINSSAKSKIAMLIYESEDGKIRGSLRTENSKIDLGEFAKFLGGGGHKRAAGFTLNGKIIKNANRFDII